MKYLFNKHSVAMLHWRYLVAQCDFYEELNGLNKLPKSTLFSTIVEMIFAIVYS